jgi:hypothetical protein
MRKPTDLFLLAALSLAAGLLPVTPVAADTIRVSMEMPKPFRGVWAEDGTSCKKRDAARHARIGKSAFVHHRSRFEVAGVRSNNERSIVADVYLVTDGARNRAEIKLDMVDNFTMLANIGGVPMVFIRCSAVDPSWGDLSGAAVDRM